jgi:T5SS/PEP-CTERM-associated repeat protein
VTVDGVGSTWTNSGSLSVGRGGTGTLAITNGGRVSSSGSSIGYGSGSTGTVTVDGAGSTWTNSGSLSVGRGGTGTLAITNGGRVSSRYYSSIGTNSGSNGTVTVDGVGSTWTSSGYLLVGQSGTGTLNITNGGTVTNSSHGYIGSGSGLNGTVTVDGVGSTWTSSGYLFVGSSGTGTLGITNGGTVNSGYSNVVYRSCIGYPPGSNGTVTVDGAGSTWNNSGPLYVGEYGMGTLGITNGGKVNSDYSYSYIGTDSGSNGTVTVDGAGSTWTNSRDLYVGYNGTGTLNITNGGKVNSGSSSYSSSIGCSIGSNGTVTVDGVGSTWTNSGLYVGYRGTGTLSITNGGTVDVGGNVGLAEDGTATGTINLIDGVLRLHGGSLSKGYGAATLYFTGGRLEGAGSIYWGGPFTQNGGALAPGNSAGTTQIDGGYTLNAGALEIEINGSAPTDLDLLKVNGAVDLVGRNGLLDGLLKVVLGFAPSLNHEFLVLENDGTDPILGAFASWTTVKASFNSSLYQFAVSYAAGDGNDIGLTTQTASLLGDYNGDGAVDAADYTVWRDSVGATVAGYFGADGNGNGQIDEADCDVWKAHFGNALPARLGDYNGDGAVDAADYTVWQDTLGSTNDLRANGDDTGTSAGVIDLADYDWWKQHFGQSAAASGLGAGSLAGAAFSPAVPEPSSLALLMGTALTLGGLARRPGRLTIQRTRQTPR